MVGVAADGDRKGRRKAKTARERRGLEIGRAFAEIIRDQPFARELLVSVDWMEPGVYLWLLTDPIGLDEEEMIFGSSMDQLYARFPDEYMLVLPVHEQNTIGDPHDGPRRDAMPIPLRAD